MRSIAALTRKATEQGPPARRGLARRISLGHDRLEGRGTCASRPAAADRPRLRFDYSGHGASGGEFRDGTISRWLDESLAVFDRYSSGPQILVGSSMGGWIALRMVQELRANADRETGSPGWC
jgi:pimeloyl-ACP methyl ester carboxylesterase